MKKLFCLSLLFLFLACSDEEMFFTKEPNVSSYAVLDDGQSRTTYYYYEGKRIPLTISNQNYYVFQKTSATENETFSWITTHTSSRTNIISKEKVGEQHKTYNYIPQKLSFAESPRKVASSNQRNDNKMYESPCLISSDGKEYTASPYIYVKLNSLNDTTALNNCAKRFSLKATRHLPYMPLWIELSCLDNKSQNAIEIANKLYETRLFASCTPDFIGNYIMEYSDPYYSDQWGLKNIGQYGGNAGIDIDIENAHCLADGYGIKVAVVDCGIDYSHPDLNPYHKSYDAYTGETLYGSSRIYTFKGEGAGNAHGTACAGIINGNLNSIGISGVAPSCQIISVCQPIKLSGSQILASGINWAVNEGADVISCSWGGPYPNDLLGDAINNALKNGRGGKGCVIVASAGNANMNTIFYPSAYNGVISVGAMDMFGKRKSESCIYEKDWGSNYGSGLSVVAPGLRISTTDITGAEGMNSGSTVQEAGLTDYSDNNYTKVFNGTSSAAPFVTGIATLMLEKQPSLKNTEVKSIIQSTCTKLPTYNLTYSYIDGAWNEEVGYGLVNAFRAVSKAITINYTYKINGNSLISSRSGNTYSVNNIPAGVYVSWSVADTKNFSVMQTSYDTCLVRANVTGKATILTARLITAANNSVMTTCSLVINSSF